MFYDKTLCHWVVFSFIFYCVKITVKSCVKNASEEIPQKKYYYKERYYNSRDKKKRLIFFFSIYYHTNFNTMYIKHKLNTPSDESEKERLRERERWTEWQRPISLTMIMCFERNTLHFILSTRKQFVCSDSSSN